KKGLQHIIERRMQDFIEKGFSKAEAEQKALEFAKSLPDIIENGSIDKGAKRVFLDTENERAVIALDYNGSDGKWILTAYIKDDKAPISAYPHQNKLTDSTSSPIVKSALTKDIIPQRSINLAMEKFHYDEAKAKDLLEWHKDSHPLTKDENGLPKVFYHGSGARFQVFKKEFDEIKTGFWFADSKIKAEDFAKDNGGKAIYPVFLKMKNPIWLTYEKRGDKWVFDWLDEEGETLLKEAKNQGLSVDYFQKDFKFKEFLQSKGYDGIVLKTKINGILQHSVFDSNQIKHIDNKGSYTDTSGKISKNKPKDSEAEHKYFNEKSENIYYSNPHLGAGLVGGML
ncbi:hypothetical protein CUPS4256_09405, partial [Campylobacter upsaliensis]|uniref:ADP-ribosyltransferase-containing protein n=1 Tax=Campylobacter upsaliensis TaxID=28080 RepID=UPI003FA47DF2|nr:hypothetical protein [Campylobacter upsaliensis]